MKRYLYFLNKQFKTKKFGKIRFHKECADFHFFTISHNNLTKTSPDNQKTSWKKYELATIC